MYIYIYYFISFARTICGRNQQHVGYGLWKGKSPTARALLDGCMVYILIKLTWKKSCSLLSKPHCATKLGPSSIGRTVLAMLLVMAKKGVWVLEQPSSSLVFRLKRFQDHLVGKTRASYLYSTFWGLAGCWFEHVIYIYIFIILRIYIYIVFIQ